MREGQPRASITGVAMCSAVPGKSSPRAINVVLKLGVRPWALAQVWTAVLRSSMSARNVPTNDP
jgi:hypothetical protein